MVKVVTYYRDQFGELQEATSGPFKTEEAAERFITALASSGKCFSAKISPWV